MCHAGSNDMGFRQKEPRGDAEDIFTDTQKYALEA